MTCEEEEIGGSFSQCEVGWLMIIGELSLSLSGVHVLTSVPASGDWHRGEDRRKCGRISFFLSLVGKWMAFSSGSWTVGVREGTWEFEKGSIHDLTFVENLVLSGIPCLRLRGLTFTGAVKVTRQEQLVEGIRDVSGLVCGSVHPKYLLSYFRR